MKTLWLRKFRHLSQILQAIVQELDILYPDNAACVFSLCCHMLARLGSKSCKLGISSTWTENFQMYKLDLEKAEEPEIKLPTSIGS